MNAVFSFHRSEENIKHLQRALNVLTSPLGLRELTIDGVFGKESVNLLREFQRLHGLQVTGSLTNESQAILDPFIDKSFVTLSKISELSVYKGLDAKVVISILRLETNLEGFDSQGRLRLEFDAPYFSKRIRQRLGARRLNKYLEFLKIDSLPSSYEGFRIASGLSLEDAYLSSSIGLANISLKLLSNKLTSYNVLDFIRLNQSNELTQLKVFLDFLADNKALTRAINSKDWLSIAALIGKVGREKDLYKDKLILTYENL